MTNCSAIGSCILESTSLLSLKTDSVTSAVSLLAIAVQVETQLGDFASVKCLIQLPTCLLLYLYTEGTILTNVPYSYPYVCIRSFFSVISSDRSLSLNLLVVD